MKPSIPFGTRRIEQFVRAAAPVMVGQLVYAVKRPRWGVKPCTKPSHIPIGVARAQADTGQGVWICQNGPAEVLVRRPQP